MKFDSSAALANHQRKFCLDGEYGSKAKLDSKLKAAVSPPTLDQGVNPDKQRSNVLSSVYLRDQVDRDRNKEMAIELDRYKEERRKVKLESMSKEGQYMQK
jgi:hypothetical protein